MAEQKNNGKQTTKPLQDGILKQSRLQRPFMQQSFKTFIRILRKRNTELDLILYTPEEDTNNGMIPPQITLFHQTPPIVVQPSINQPKLKCDTQNYDENVYTVKKEQLRIRLRRDRLEEKFTEKRIMDKRKSSPKVKINKLLTYEEFRKLHYQDAKDQCTRQGGTFADFTKILESMYRVTRAKQRID